VVLLGLDGADWLVLDPLIEAGKVPTLARLRSRGRTGTLLATPPLLSPILWTTIATGRSPEDHRILDFMVDLPTGGQVPVPSTERRVSALWNLFSAAGRTVGVVGWWATWPAEDVRGTIVSDRVAPQLIRSGEVLDQHAISPLARAAALVPKLVRAADLTPADLAAYLPLAPGEYESARRSLLTAGSSSYDDPVAHLAAIVASTRSHGRMVDALMADGQPDLLLVYLEAIDSLSHRFIGDARRGPGVIERAYRDADELLARLARGAASGTWILVCSDHGFQPRDAAIAENPAELAGPATAWHRPYGIVAAAEARDLVADGPGPSLDVGLVTPLDITPTILHLAALPVSLEMPGRVVAELLPPEAAARAVAHVRSLEPPRRPEAPAVTLGADPGLLGRLQALGYVGARTTSLARLNLGEILYRRRRYDAAERELRAVVEAQPRNLAALLWLAKAVREQGRPQAALAVYERALALGGDTGDVLIEAVDLAVSAGHREEARRLAAGHAGPAAAVARAMVAQADGRADVAEREIRSALAAEPAFLPALSRLLDLFVPARRAREALPALTRAADLAPGSPRHQALLGAALLAAGDAAGAETRFQRALRLAPDGATLRIDLARAQLAQLQVEAALATLGATPPSRERSILLGAVASRKGDWPEAAKHYREALEGGAPTPDLLNALAWAEIKLGRTREAAELLGRSLGLDPDQAEIGRILAELRRPEAR